jgi:hypothetical protein
MFEKSGIDNQYIARFSEKKNNAIYVRWLFSIIQSTQHIKKFKT